MRYVDFIAGKYFSCFYASQKNESERKRKTANERMSISFFSKRTNKNQKIKIDTERRRHTWEYIHKYKFDVSTTAITALFRKIAMENYGDLLRAKNFPESSSVRTRGRACVSECQSYSTCECSLHCNFTFFFPFSSPFPMPSSPPVPGIGSFVWHLA